MNVVSPTNEKPLRQVVGGAAKSLQDCSRDECDFHPDHRQVAGHCPFGVIGLSYRTASLDLRGRASFAGDRAIELLSLLRRHHVSEAMVLSTCNRTEVYFAGPDPEQVIGLIAEAAQTPAAELRPHLYIKHGICAACHLFRVTSGLDSAVLGETEIVAQVKQAWRLAEELGSTGPGLSFLLQRSMEVNKRVRSETDLCKGVTSTATLAVLQAEATFGSLRDRSILLLGAGQIAERVCKELVPRSPKALRVLNRTLGKAERLAAIYGGEAGTLDDLPEALASADVVITALTTPKPVIVDDLLKGRSEPQIMIDLGVPANIDVSPGSANVRVLNIDSLSATCSENLGRRAQAVPLALDIIEEERLRLHSELTMRTAAPTIKALVDHADSIRRANLAWAMDRLTGLNEKERKVVEDLSAKIVKGLLQAPIQGLKSDLTANEHREIVSKLFKLEEAHNEPLAS